MFNILTAPTAAEIFTEAGATMTGFMTMVGNFFTTLWDNPMGKIILTLGLVSGAIALCRGLFLKRKKV